VPIDGARRLMAFLEAGRSTIDVIVLVIAPATQQEPLNAGSVWSD
jgi:ParB-like chromosome segregation protein Spo0J